MIWTCLLLCAMVHFTVCCKNDKEIQCTNKTATVGENITLTCNVSKNGSCINYKWNKTETNLELEAKNCSSVTDRKFIYIIKNASMTHNGTYRFWIQLNTGALCTSFILNISEKIPSDVRTETEKRTDEIADHLQGTEVIPTDSPATRKHTGIFVAVAAALGLIVLAVLSKKTPDRASLHYIV